MDDPTVRQVYPRGAALRRPFLVNDLLTTVYSGNSDEIGLECIKVQLYIPVWWFGNAPRRVVMGGRDTARTAAVAARSVPSRRHFWIR